MRIVFATNNAHKLEEIRAILGHSHDILSLNDIQRPQTRSRATPCRRHATYGITTT